jgi:hypothetical protein
LPPLLLFDDDSDNGASVHAVAPDFIASVNVHRKAAIANHHLRNRELTLKAKGLLSQMLSLPDEWDFTLVGLAAINRRRPPGRVLPPHKAER